MLTDNKAEPSDGKLVWYMVQRGGLLPRQGGARMVSSPGGQVRPETTAVWSDAGSLNPAEPQLEVIMPAHGQE